MGPGHTLAFSNSLAWLSLRKNETKTNLVIAILSFFSVVKCLRTVTKVTLESCSEVVVSTRIPEFHMLVCPPRNALLHQRNSVFGAIGNMIKLQGV